MQYDRRALVHLGGRGLVVVMVMLLGACERSEREHSTALEDGASTPQATVPSELASNTLSEQEVANDPADVIRRYYEAINRGDYRTAYLMWSDSGKASNQTYEEFVAGFADTRSVSVEVGKPGPHDPGAGSDYMTIPVIVHAVTKSGKRKRYAGTYQLSRVLPGAGATPEQERWHIVDASIEPVQD